MQALSLETAERLFFWSNALYVFGALLTLGGALLILQHQRGARLVTWLPVLSRNVLLVPAGVCVLGTLAAITFSSFVLNRERAALAGYRLQVALELTRLRSNIEADRLSGRQAALKESAEDGLAPSGGDTVKQADSLEDIADSGGYRQLDLGPGAGESLRDFGGMRAMVEAESSDEEAAQFADHLMLLLIANGIDARQGKEGSVIHQLVGQPGIHVRYKDPNGGHDLAAALARLLRSHGLRVDVAPSWDVAAGLDKTAATGSREAVRHDQVLISVGPKPS